MEGNMAGRHSEKAVSRRARMAKKDRARRSSHRKISARKGVAATAAIAATCAVLAPVIAQEKTIAVTLTSTVIGIGGLKDDTSTLLKNKIGGSFLQPDDKYTGIKYPAAVWPVSGLTAPTLDQSVALGSKNLNTALNNLDTNEPTTIVGYSLGAVAVNSWRKEHGEQAAKDGRDIQFYLIANAYKPNGGILARFPGLFLPIGISSQAPIDPKDGFKTIDVTNEYDTYGDFPAYFNPLALANSLMGIQYAHPDKYYDDVDISKLTPIEDPITKTKYYLVPSKHLPLLQPIRDFTDQFGASFVLDAIEPTLRVFIDMAYDRQTSPGQQTPFGLFTPIKNIVDALNKLPGAIQEGAHNFENGLSGIAPKQPAPAADPAKTPAAPSDTKTKTEEKPVTTPKTPDQILTLTTPQPVTPTAPTTAPEPITVTVGAVTTATPASPPAVPATPATPNVTPATSTADTTSTPAGQPATKVETKTQENKTQESKPDEKQAPTVDKSNDTTKPTLHQPKIPAAQPGSTPKTPKLPSIRDSLKSVPGVGITKSPTTAPTGGGTETGTGNNSAGTETSSSKTTGDTGTSSTSKTGNATSADHTKPDHTKSSEHSGSGDHSSSSGHSSGNAA